VKGLAAADHEVLPDQSFAFRLRCVRRDLHARLAERRVAKDATIDLFNEHIFVAVWTLNDTLTRWCQAATGAGLTSTTTTWARRGDMSSLGYTSNGSVNGSIIGQRFDSR